MFTFLFRNLLTASKSRKMPFRKTKRKPACRLGVEQLEDRLVLATLLQSIYPPDAIGPQALGVFGEATATDTSFHVVGMPYAEIDGLQQSGVAFVYSATTGALVATLTNPSPAAGDWFGWSVSVSGNTVVVGAHGYGPGASFATSQAYVFDAPTGALFATLANPSPDAGDQFGYSVSLSGNILVVGAFGDDTGADSSGQAYVLNATTGTLIATLANPFPAGSDQFGYSVSVSGNTVVVGAILADGGASHCGQAYTFDALTGALIATLANPAPTTFDYFGYSVSVSENTVVVGAFADDTGGANSGQAYVFDATTGALIDTLAKASPADGDAFGISVSISGNTALVGAVLDDTQNVDQGAAYVYTLDTAPNNLSLILNATSINEDGSSTLSGTFVDPGTLDVHTVTINWGPGEGSTTLTLPVGARSFNFSHQFLDDNPTGTGSDSYLISVTVNDDDTGSVSASTSVSVNNVASAIDTLSATSVDENGTIHLTGTYHDVGTLDTHTRIVNWGEGVPQTVTVTGGSFDIIHQYQDDNPSGTTSDIYTIGVTLTDDDTGAVTGSTTTTITNVAPTVAAISATVGVNPANVDYPVAVTTTISASANFTDPGLQDTHTAQWDWGDGTSAGAVTETLGSGSVTGSHTYSAAGVYTVKLTVTDDDTGAGISSYQYVVVYDPTAGFVTGGGWITSPAGADRANEAATAKANFGFVSQYKKGATEPTGQTEFQFQAGNLNFQSTSYEWLVVAGARAQYKGVGTINGTGNYGFMLTAIDGQVSGGGGVDKFRIKIWDKVSGGLRYDNQLMNTDDDAAPTTELGGGQIVIHKDPKTLLASGGVAVGMAGGTLSQESLNQAVDQAITYWRNSGVDAATVSNLRQIHVQVADLSDAVLGIASDTDYVWIDRDAAGYGWQLYSLSATNNSRLAPGMDLLSVVAHELGHKLGLEHSHDDADLMAPALQVGIRTLLGNLGQTMAFLGSSWAIPESLRSDVTRLSSRDTLRLPMDDTEDIQAHDQLFGRLDAGPAKPGWRSPRIRQEFVSDAKQIPDPEDEDLLEEDLLEALAWARLAAQP